MPTERRLPSPPKSSPIDGVGGSLNYDWWRWLHLISKWLPKIETYTVAYDATSVAANTSVEQNVTVAGLTTSDIITVNGPVLVDGLGIVNARVSAANTLTLRFMNTTGGALDAASGTYKIVAIRL